jgi:hypothetical protein
MWLRFLSLMLYLSKYKYGTDSVILFSYIKP